MTIKSRTLRLPADEAEALEAIGGVDDVSVNEEIQQAIAAHIEARRSDARRIVGGHGRPIHRQFSGPADPGSHDPDSLTTANHHDVCC